jgi:outer membrane protein assembly factor BamD
MKKLITLLVLAIFTGCAKEPAFDPVEKFRDAEEKMRRFKYEEARKAYQEIQEKAPDRSYDADIMLRIADTYFGEEKYAEAQVEYQAFINFHPVHRDASYAQYQVAMCSFNEITTIDRDPSLTRAALKEFQNLLAKYPGSPYEEEAIKNIALCRGMLAEYELYVGRFYYKKGSYQAALGRLEKLLKDYPGTAAEKDALYYIGLSYQERGDKAKAIRAFESLVAKYPDMAHEAGKHIMRLKEP